MVESTGVVVTPYLDYPQLLGMLLRLLNEGTPETRKDLLKVLRPPLRSPKSGTATSMLSSAGAALWLMSADVA